MLSAYTERCPSPGALQTAPLAASRKADGESLDGAVAVEFTFVVVGVVDFAGLTAAVGLDSSGWCPAPVPPCLALGPPPPPLWSLVLLLLLLLVLVLVRLLLLVLVLELLLLLVLLLVFPHSLYCYPQSVN